MAGPKEYVVKPGDTLWDIAERVYGDGTQWQKLYFNNQDVIDNPRMLMPGMKIMLDATDKGQQLPPNQKPEDKPGHVPYTVQSGDNLSDISARTTGDARNWGDIYGASDELGSNPNMIFPGQNAQIPMSLLDLIVSDWDGTAGGQGDPNTPRPSQGPAGAGGSEPRDPAKDPMPILPDADGFVGPRQNPPQQTPRQNNGYVQALLLAQLLSNPLNMLAAFGGQGIRDKAASNGREWAQSPPGSPRVEDLFNFSSANFGSVPSILPPSDGQEGRWKGRDREGRPLPSPPRRPGGAD
jgi:hypothetical protein